MPLLGSYGNQIGPTVQGFQFYNKESTVDKTTLSFSMWKTTIKIAIFPLIESEDDQVRYDRKNGLSIFLTPIKAKMFAHLVRKFMENPHDTVTRGVSSGTNLITIEDPTNPEGFNRPGAGPVIVIRKISPEGNLEASYAYETKVDNNMFVENFNEKNGSFVKNIDEFRYIELDMIAMQLEEYVKAMTNTVSFTTADALYGCLDKIATKLGVDLGSSYNGGYTKNNYFNTSTGMPPTQSNNGLDKMMDDGFPF